MVTAPDTLAWLDRLDALAAEATPGPWAWEQWGMKAAILRPDGSHMVIGDALYHPENLRTAAYIAACDPATGRRLTALARLGATWQAVEGALPGWINRTKAKDPDGDWEDAEQDFIVRVDGNVSGYEAGLYDQSNDVINAVVEADGPTPAAALLALRAKLDERP